MKNLTEIESTSDRVEIRKRLKVMIELAHMNTSSLESFLRLPKNVRQHGRKRDGTAVTRIDYEINKKTMDYYLSYFPEDSFDGEEIQMIEPYSKFTLLEDPVDATSHAVDYTPENNKHYWPTYMLSLLCNGLPVAFALGVPLMHEIYSGSVHDGISLNGNRFRSSKGSLLLKADRVISSEKWRKIVGYHDVHIAGLCAWLIVRGVISAGICPFPLPHESSCIAAAALSAGAIVRNRLGQQFQPYNTHDGMVWTFDEKLMSNLFA